MDPILNHVMVRRVAAAQATFDAFHLRPFAWGVCDCAKLGAHLVRQFGYAPPFAKAGRYGNPGTAQRALERAGFKDLAEAVDGLGFARIPPAAMLPGDLAGFRCVDQEMPVGLCVAMGAGRVLGFLEDRLCRVFSPTYGVPGAEYMAWRTI